MKHHPELIVMLTYEDRTVLNATKMFEQCKNSKARIWGMKEEPLPLDEMKNLFALIRSCGKQTALEVVAYSEKEGIDGAKTALECGCDYLLGTCYYDSIAVLCREHGIKYMPYVGQISERPSVLAGSIDDMIAEARSYAEKGVYGVNLLGYRYTGDTEKLIRRLVGAVDAPVVVAGSVDSYQRLDELKKAAPWAFTIGSAFFDNEFNGSFEEQINKVVDYMQKDA